MRLKCKYLVGDSGYQFVKESVQKCFQEDIVLQQESSSLEHHGWFLLEYMYIPRNCCIIIEVEFNGFSVKIQEEDGRFIYLNQLVYLKNEMKENNIIEMLDNLKKILKRPSIF